MALDYEKLKSGLPSHKQTDPRKIFTMLKRDTSKFKRPSDEQGDVLDLWYGKRNRADNTLKMNTGSGKTVVGLLCLQSSLNEGSGPAVYVTPDNYLVRQVVAEAAALGITVTEDEEDPGFIAGNSILVINIRKLVNGKSVFGVGREGAKIEIGSLVIDDAHACLATVAEQFRIRLTSVHAAYGPLLELFRPDLENQSESGYLDVEAQDPRIAMAVPFWAWKNKQSEVLKILHPHRLDDVLKWPWRLVEDVLPLCQCAFGGGHVEIAPRFVPIDNIPAFTAAENLEEGTDKLRKGHVGLTVFVAKYDGVDLPDKACEVLVIDGLPEVYGLLERIEQEALDGTRRQLLRQVQRIEQGMGRGVRSSQDHCVVILMGAKLTQRLHRQEARAMFSPATRAQLDLGRVVTAQLKGQPLEEIAKVMGDCLEGDDDWIDASRSAVVSAEPGDASHIDESVVVLRKAFDLARARRFDLAELELRAVVDKTTEKRAKGYLTQQLAEHVHHLDRVKAQEIQLAAVQYNPAMLRPIEGIAYRKLDVPKASQAATAVDYMKRFLEKNDLIMWVNALAESLAWGEENSAKFENAMQELGSLLGFGSQQPEKESGRGADNLWALGGLQFLVIECKSGAVKAKTINKHDCNQLNGSMTWFGKQYDASCKATPVMVHPKIAPEHAATLHADTRIVTEECLSRLLDAVRKYSVAIGQKNGYADANVVSAQLNHFGLCDNDLVARYTVKPRG
jgi:hypothetical protein